jgi:hypothetical protein
MEALAIGENERRRRRRRRIKAGVAGNLIRLCI